MVTVWCEIENEAGPIDPERHPARVADLLNNELAVVLAAVVGELRRRDAWSGPYPTLRLVPVGPVPTMTDPGEGSSRAVVYPGRPAEHYMAMLRDLRASGRV